MNNRELREIKNVLTRAGGLIKRTTPIFIALFLLGSVSCLPGQQTDEQTSEQPNEHLLYGNPGGRGQLLIKNYYVISHDNEYKVPVWVAVHITTENLMGDAERSSSYFKADPDLLPDQRAELEDYSSSGFDRGHMAEADAFKRSVEAMKECFLLSNMAPQYGHTNGGRWRVIEGEVRILASYYGDAWVFTGPLYLDADGNPSVPTEFIGDNRVAVPTHFFKVALTQDRDDEFEMFAFLVGNLSSGHTGHQSIEYLVSVDRIESLSALDFFADLPDSLEFRLESEVAAEWPPNWMLIEGAEAG